MTIRVRQSLLMALVFNLPMGSGRYGTRSFIPQNSGGQLRLVIKSVCFITYKELE